MLKAAGCEWHLAQAQEPAEPALLNELRVRLSNNNSISDTTLSYGPSGCVGQPEGVSK